MKVINVIRHNIAPVLAALVGGYVLTWGICSVVITLMVYAGASFHSAEYTAVIVAFPAFLLFFLWIFLQRKRVRAASVFALIGIALTMSAAELQSLIIAGASSL